MFPAGQPDIRIRTITVGDGSQTVRLRVAESGRPDARPILLLHGWGASLYMWRDWFAPLATAGWRPVALDLPGHGLSDKPLQAGAYRLESQVALLRAVIAQERFDGAAVVAQSMAGTIALELLLGDSTAVGRVALVNPACFGRIRIQRIARVFSPAVVDVVLHRLIGRWVVARAHRLVFGDPSRVRARDEDEYWAPSQFPDYARAMRRLVHEFSWARPPAEIMARRLRELTAPLLVVLGTRDRLVRDAAPYVSALRDMGAPLVVREVLGGGHAVNEERPAEVLSLVVPFLTRGVA